MDWKKVNVPQGGKLFQVHNFTYMHKGTTYAFEIDEFADGSVSGHGEQANDKSSVLESVSGRSIAECIQNLIDKIQD